MSHKEIDRLMVIEQCDNRTIRQSVAARQLGISARHLRRLLKRYRTEGAAGLVYRRRGQAANNAIADNVRLQALSLLVTHYHDFGPTLAHEYLTEQHGLQFSVETLRQWMIVEGCGKAKTGVHVFTRVVHAATATVNWCRLTVRRMTGSKDAPTNAR